MQSAHKLLALLSDSIINMDGRTITPTASDGLTATDFNATCTGGQRVNGVLTFDGVDDFVQLPSTTIDGPFNPNEGGEIFEFSYLDNDPAANSFLFAIGVNSSNRIYAYKTTTAGQIAFAIKFGGTTEAVTINGLSANTVYRGGIERTGGNVRFFMGGVQQGSTQTIAGTWVGTVNDTNCVLAALTNAPSSPIAVKFHAMVIALGAAPVDIATATSGSTALTAANLDSYVGGDWLHYE